MVERLNYEGVEFPVSVKDYGKIEEQNSININVFGYENKEFYPICVSKQHKEDILNLLSITKGENKHYVFIVDFNSLLFNKTKYKERKHFCMYCLQCFSSGHILSKHETNCMVINGELAIRMSQKGKITLGLQNYSKQMPVPFVIYGDFEAITEKVLGCQPDNAQSYTDKYQKHTSCSYGYKVVCCHDDKHKRPVKIYRGEKRIQTFMQEMLKEVEYKVEGKTRCIPYW